MRYIGLLWVVLGVLWIAPSGFAQDNCSQGNGQAASVLFTNFSDQMLTVSWVNVDCELEPYGTISPMGEFEQATFDGHTWIVQTEDGRDVAVLRASSTNPLQVIVNDVFNVTGEPLALMGDCSLQTSAETTVSFTNLSQTGINTTWSDFDCNLIDYSFLRLGEVANQQTLHGHVWKFTTDDGTPSGTFIASASATVEVVFGVGASDGGAPDPVVPLYDVDAVGFSYRPQPFEDVPVDILAGCMVEPIPADLGFDPFYTQFCSSGDVNIFNGIPVMASDDVYFVALFQAWGFMMNMLRGHDALIEVMLENDVRIAIVGQDQGITDLPEYNFLKDDPNTDWDDRSRGFGATLSVPLGSGAEENILCYIDDRYLGENIFIHEFAHTMKTMGLDLIDPAFGEALQAVYDMALANGLWDNTYAITNVDEYWAEGVQTYFNVNLEANPADGIHNAVNTREELAIYDPALFAIIDTIFAGTTWYPVCPG